MTRWVDCLYMTNRVRESYFGSYEKALVIMNSRPVSCESEGHAQEKHRYKKLIQTYVYM